MTKGCSRGAAQIALGLQGSVCLQDGLLLLLLLYTCSAHASIVVCSTLLHCGKSCNLHLLAGHAGQG